MRTGPGHRHVPQFTCEWQCLCGSVIGWSGAEALVKSQTGAHRHCPHCGQHWKITDKGATALPKPEWELADPAELAHRMDLEYHDVSVPTLGGDVLDRIAMEMDDGESPRRESSD